MWRVNMTSGKSSFMCKRTMWSMWYLNVWGKSFLAHWTSLHLTVLTCPLLPPFFCNFWLLSTFSWGLWQTFYAYVMSINRTVAHHYNVKWVVVWLLGADLAIAGTNGILFGIRTLVLHTCLSSGGGGVKGEKTWVKIFFAFRLDREGQYSTKSNSCPILFQQWIPHYWDIWTV